MSETDFNLGELTAVGAHRRGHFTLSSGRHSSDYLQCALYLSEPSRAERAGRLIAEKVLESIGSVTVEAVVSPAMGGVIIGHEVARALGVPFVFSERKDDEMVIRRGFSLEPGLRVVVVEDVVTTGRSSREVFALLDSLRVEVACLASIVDRLGESRLDGVPFFSLLAVDLPTFDPESCPLCRDGRAIEKPGSRTGA